MPIPSQYNQATFDDTFKIRPIRMHAPAEKAAVVSLINRCYRGPDNWTNESALVKGLRIHTEALEASLRTFEILVVEHRLREEVIACVRTGITYKTMGKTLAEPAGYLGLFAVLPEFQSRGVGSRLMKAAETYCASKGVSKMCIDVLHVRQDIIEWYNRCGYRRVGGSVDAGPLIEEGGETLLVPCSFILMQKSFTPERNAHPSATVLKTDECINSNSADEKCAQGTGMDDALEV